MSIKITNNDSNKIIISDLGIELNNLESTYLDDYDSHIILDSEELKILIESNVLLVEIDSMISTYSNFSLYLKSLNMFDHENLNTFVHNLSEQSFMIVSKEDNVVKYITYYTDSSMTNKIREEEIIRENGRSSKIIIRQYNKLGSVLFTEEQNLNRNSTGKVESISVIKK